MPRRVAPLALVAVVLLAAAGCSRAPAPERIAWRLVDAGSDARAPGSTAPPAPLRAGALGTRRGPARATIADDSRYTFARPALALIHRAPQLALGPGGEIAVEVALPPAFQGCEELLVQLSLAAGTVREGRWVVSPCVGSPPRRHVRIEGRAPTLRGGTTDLWVHARPVPPAGTWQRRFALDLVPAGARLALGFGIEPAGWEPRSAAVFFSVRAEGTPEPLLIARVDPAGDPTHRRWFDASVDLSSYAGRPLTLVLETILDTTGGRRPVSVPVWGDPTVLVAAGDPTPRWNLVLVSLDTLRPQSVSAYGAPRPTTPFLDHLAAEGALFQRAAAQSTITPVSHMSLMTGLYPATHGVTDLRRASDLERYATLAELLRAAGYATGGVTEDGLLHAALGFERGFDQYRENKSPDLAATIGHVEHTFDDASAWMRAHARLPFFLFVHTYQVHAPYAPPEEYRGIFGPERAGLAGELDRYEEEIRYTDKQLRRLWKSVVSLGLAERTLLVVTSDHGEEFGEHGAKDHGGHLYEETLLVPLVLHAPGLVRQGARVDEPVALVDVLPTLLELLGLPPTSQAQGRSLAPLVTAGGSGGDALAAALRARPIYAEAWAATRMRTDGTLDPAWQPPAYALRTGDLKLVWTPPKPPDRPQGRLEVYDLARDPGERHDLAGGDDPRIAPAYRDLERYAATGTPADAAEVRQALEGFDAETQDKLRALGYLR